MWHRNSPDTPKPEGRVLVRTKYHGFFVADWTGVCWVRVPGHYSLLNEHVTHWHEIPPFDAGEGE